MRLLYMKTCIKYKHFLAGVKCYLWFLLLLKDIANIKYCLNPDTPLLEGRMFNIQHC